MEFSDVEELFWKMKKIHPNMFYHITEVQFLKELEKSKENWENLDKYEKIYELMRLDALLGDIHTNVIIPDWDKGFPFIPIKLKEGVFLLNIDKNSLDEKLLNSRIIKVNGVPVEEIIELAKRIFSSENPQAQEADVAEKLDRPVLFKILGISKNDEPEFTLLQNDEEIVVKMKPRRLDQRPNWAVKLRKKYSYRVTKDYLYIDIKKFAEVKNNPLAKIYLEIYAAIKEDKPIIFDVRRNYGGDPEVFIPFCMKIPKNYKNGFCIMDNISASASVDLVEVLRQVGFTLVGQSIAQDSTYFADAWEIQTSFGLKAKVSTALVEPYKEDSNSRVFSRSTNLYKRAIMPDVYIEPSIEDVKKGEDPCLNYCIAEVKKMERKIEKFEETEFVA